MTTPLDIVKQKYSDYQAEQAAKEPPAPEPVIHIAKKVDDAVIEVMGDEIPQVKSINDLVYVKPGGADEIIGDRFLCRRGGLLFPAPTGIGKSTFVIQTLCQAALGHEAYGLRFTRPTKTLYVQAENDDSDLAGMRDGIYEASDFNVQEVNQIGDRLLVLNESNRTGIKLIEYIRGVIDEFRPDLLVLDPIFSYLGGSASEQAMVSMFLRNMLNPMMLETDIACWLVHHTNKPPSGEQKREWQGGEFAYLGAGSAEWANWARATLTIRQIGLDDVFELRAGKRGRRLRWQDPDGNPVVHRYIAHAKGSICWQEADWNHVQDLLGGGEEKRPQGRPTKDIDPESIKKLPDYPFVTKEGAIHAVMGMAKCGERTAIKLVDKHMIKLGEGKDARWKIG